MLDALFDEEITVRRLAGPRDGHGKPTLVTVCEPDSDVPLFVDCFIDRHVRNVRTVNDGTKAVDATLQYNAGEAPVKLRDADLVHLAATGETFRVETLHEQSSAVEGSEYAFVGLLRVKTAVAADAQRSAEA